MIGKFLAAAAIFTCSLVFSQISNYTVLIALSLGELDTGLLMSLAATAAMLISPCPEGHGATANPAGSGRGGWREDRVLPPPG